MDRTMNQELLAEQFPILDFDSLSEPILRSNHEGLEIVFPRHLILCFFREVIEKVVLEYGGKELYTFRSEVKPFPFYEIGVDGKRLPIDKLGVGAPVAVMQMETGVALGARYVVACGGCGVLDHEIACGHILLPTSAFREEGTSYHYLPPSAEVEIDEKSLRILEETLKEHGVDYLRTKTWTTDAAYHETERKAAAYLAKGCLAVEMEVASLAAVAKFRGVDYAQYLYAGDAVVAKQWDNRAWNDRSDIRENLFWLSVDACLKMGD